MNNWQVSTRHDEMRHLMEYHISISEESVDLFAENLREVVANIVAKRIADELYEEARVLIKAEDMTPFVLTRALENLAERLSKSEEWKWTKQVGNRY